MNDGWILTGGTPEAVGTPVLAISGPECPPPTPTATATSPSTEIGLREARATSQTSLGAEWTVAIPVAGAAVVGAAVIWLRSRRGR